MSLSCKATGTPVPTISWQRTDGRELKFQTGGRFRTPKSGLLEIVLLEPEDMATYQCVAQNEVGVDVGYVQLVVHCKYIFKSVGISPLMTLQRRF